MVGRSFFITILCIGFSLNVNLAKAQKNETEISSSYFVGKWTFGYRDTIKKSAISIRRWEYIFYKDGTYKENRKSYEGKRPRKFVRGKWEYRNNKLVMDDDDTEVTKTLPQEFEVIIINSKLFWDVGEEGPGVLVYTFHKKR